MKHTMNLAFRDGGSAMLLFKKIYIIIIIKNVLNALPWKPYIHAESRFVALIHRMWYNSVALYKNKYVEKDTLSTS